MNKQKLGQLGESIASHYLQRQGYQILQKNWHYKKLEIDLVTIYHKKLIFIEVKTRRQNYLASEILKNQQIINLQRAGQEFCYQKKLNWEQVSFDLIFIIIHLIDRQITIKHWKGII